MATIAMTIPSSRSDRERLIRALFDDYIEMYAGRDDRLIHHFSDNFSGHTGGGDFLVKDRMVWEKVTRQDFAQVPERIRFELLDLSLQDISDDVVLVTALFHIHLPIPDPAFAEEVARLVLLFRLEDSVWKIVHNSYSIPDRLVQNGEIYPLQLLREKNKALEALVEERTQALHDSEALHRLLTEDAQDVLWKLDSNFCVTYISPADERVRGFKANEVVGHSVLEMFTPEGVAIVKDVMRQGQEARQSGATSYFLTFEAPHLCKDGRVIWGEVLSKPDRNAQGDIVGYHGITREITERKRLQDQVRQLAFFDPLTQLPNRRLLSDRLSQAMATSKRSACYGALMFLDLDNFKPLNDAHGHVVGDLLLMEVANRITRCVRETDTVARFGGDEFVVLLGELTTEEVQSGVQACLVAEKIRGKLCEPYQLIVAQDNAAERIIEHRCSVSIGVTLFLGTDSNPNDVLTAADAAMYRAKDAGRNSVWSAVAFDQSDVSQ
ncbi:MAG: diguanylate cyclase [Rhodoferax sp.]|nr:diguanylate cyclase [Rhodoferax sp.]